MQNIHDIYSKHIGKVRADKASDLYFEHRKEKKRGKDACSDKKGKNKEFCKKKTAGVRQSEITCPECGHKKVETMPTNLCLLKYVCEKCKTDLFQKNGSCCVFCSYGSVKCPSMQ